MSRLRWSVLVAVVLCLFLGLAVPAWAVSPPAARWQKSLAPGSDQLYLGLSYIDPAHGWLCSWSGAVSATSDGGKTWGTVSLGYAGLRDVDFISASTGWTVSEAGDIYKSTDGGATWVKQRSMPSLGFYSVEAIDASNVWVGGTNGALLSTTDGGDTWVSHDIGSLGTVVGIAFNDVSTGWVVDGEDARRTTDGGATWQKVPLEFVLRMSVQYPGMVSSPSKDVVVIADGNVSAFSRDGGATWTTAAVPTWQVTGICAVDETHAWLCSADGEIFVTDDSGASWSSQSTDCGRRVIADLVIFGQRGIAAGQDVLTTERTGLGGDLRPPITAVELDPSPGPEAHTSAIRVPTTLTFSATDESSAVTSTFFRLDGGAWQSGLLSLLDAPADHSKDGPHTLELCSVDAAGNDEVGNERTLFVDTRIPSMTAWSGEDDMMGYWINHSSVVELTVSDPAPSSGVRAAQRVDGKWSYGETQVTVTALKRHGNDGLHKVLVRAYDGAGNASADTEYIVGIDTRLPMPSVPGPCRIKKGSTGRVAFRINDAKPCSGVCVVGILIVRPSGKVVAKYSPRKWYKANTPSTYSFRCNLAKGAYKLLVYGADGAGNVRKRPAIGDLTVY